MAPNGSFAAGWGLSYQCSLYLFRRGRYQYIRERTMEEISDKTRNGEEISEKTRNIGIRSALRQSLVS
jgi:hypothetical protein